MPRRAVVPTTALLAFVLAGCGFLPTSSTPVQTPVPEYRPEVVGVVVSRDLLGDLRSRLTLRDGEQIEIDRAVDLALQNSDPDKGDLLLYGKQPEPWFYALGPGNGPDCYGLDGLATETNGSLHFDFGLVLPKATGFDRGSGNFRRPGGSFFCVNERGELTRLYE